jgi:VWFA-related protein
LTSLTFVLFLSGAAVTTAAEHDSHVPPTSFAAGTERVKVDVVVRDKKNAILRGLTAADLDVYEDGVRQTIESLNFVEQRSVGLDEIGYETAASPPAFVAVAFDRLGATARSFAEQAAREYLDRALPARSWMGVFSIDRGLSTLQPFTDDREALRRSLDRAAAGATTSFAGVGERDAIRNAYAGLATGFGQAHVAAAELAGAPECRAAEDEIIRRMEILESRLMESFQSLERDQQGFATAHALLALIGALEPLPGRKAILLFSEGLTIPADVESSFVSVVAAANRANVSIYGADAGGLRAASAADETRRTIDSIQTRLRLQDDHAANPLSRDGTVREATSGLALLEKNEDALRFDPGSGLGRLADQTGGFLIRDTNDLSSGLAEMSEDLCRYYVVSYTPRNTNYDGRFRTITMRLKHPHGRLQARKGYLAVRTAMPVPVLDYEASALARLESGPRPAGVSVLLRGLQFPEEPPLSVVPIMVEVPARGLHDLTIVVLVRDASRRVVAKMSQRYALAGPGAHPDASTVLFHREVQLSAGSYQLEAVAYDARSGAAGAATARLEVPPSAADRLRASSLMVVGRAEKLAAGESRAAQPLRYGDVLLYPNLGQTVRRAADRTLTFFVTAWPAAERPAIDARLEVVHDGRTVSATRSASLRPDAAGRIQLASSLPLDGFSPGAYELRLTLSDGRDEEVRTAAVPIAP